MKAPKIKRTYLYYYHKLFPRNGEPLSVAWAVFWGVWIGVMPTIGIAIPLTLLVCQIFKMPKGPGAVASFVAIPPTQFGFFYPTSYLLGKQFIDTHEIPFSFLDKFSELRLNNVGQVMGELWGGAQDHVLAFLLGITIEATLTGFLFFFLALFVMRAKKKMRLQKQEEKASKIS